MKILLCKITLILLILFGLISCSDDPNSVGIGLLQQDIIGTHTIDTKDNPISQQSSYFKEIVPLSLSSKLLLGKRGNTEASILMNFIFAIEDSLKQDFLNDVVTVSQAYIEMTPKYTFTDENANFDFSVHKITSDWSITGFTFDSLANLTYDDIDLSSNKNFTDSIYTFDLENDFVTSWIKNTIDTSLGKNRGIFFKPEDNSGKIVGFQALTASTTEQSQLKVVIAKQGTVIDTLSAYLIGDVSVVDGEMPTLPDDEIVIQASTTLQSKLFFDLSELPSGIAINKAELILTIDNSNSLTGSSYSSNMSVLRVSDSSTSALDERNVMTLVKKDSIFTGEISALVRYWIVYGNNFGMVIRTASLIEGLELFAIKGSDAIQTERPRLKIVYTSKEDK